MNPLKCRTLGAPTFQDIHGPLDWLYCACALSGGKWPTVRMAVKKESAGSLQPSGFRENSTNFLTSVAHWVRDSIFRMNWRSRGEMWLNRQTDTHTDTHRPNCGNGPVHVRWGLIHVSQYKCYPAHTDMCLVSREKPWTHLILNAHYLLQQESITHTCTQRAVAS